MERCTGFGRMVASNVPEPLRVTVLMVTLPFHADAAKFHGTVGSDIHYPHIPTYTLHCKNIHYHYVLVHIYCISMIALVCQTVGDSSKSTEVFENRSFQMNGPTKVRRFDERAKSKDEEAQHQAVMLATCHIGADMAPPSSGLNSRKKTLQGTILSKTYQTST